MQIFPACLETLKHLSYPQLRLPTWVAKVPLISVYPSHNLKTALCSLANECSKNREQQNVLWCKRRNEGSMREPFPQLCCTCTMWLVTRGLRYSWATVGEEEQMGSTLLNAGGLPKSTDWKLDEGMGEEIEHKTGQNNLWIFWKEWWKQ